MDDTFTLAASPQTPAAALAELAKGGPMEVCRRVARNPAVGLATAVQLCAYYADDVLANPALPLWLIDNPAFFAQLPSSAAAAVAQASTVTLAQLWQLAEHPDSGVRYALATSSLATGELLEYLVFHPTHQRHDFRFLETIARNPKTPPYLLEHLYEKGSDYIGRALGLNPHLPRSLLDEMAHATSAWHRAGAACSPLLPLPLLRRLADDEQTAVRSAAASNPSMPPQLLRRLSRDPAAEVRLAVARNPRTPLLTLLALRSDRNSHVHLAAVHQAIAPAPRSPSNP